MKKLMAGLDSKEGGQEADEATKALESLTVEAKDKNSENTEGADK
jgi:hypothetical protein